MRRRILLIAAAAAAVAGGLLLILPESGYYLQAVRGHLAVLRARRPIGELLADPQLSPARRAALETVAAARDFAVGRLALPDSDSYRDFADLGRPYVVWNVVAAPEFSLAPRRWCFPVAGCVSYRGYFSAAQATAAAARYAAEGDDTDVYGVRGYSTLGWFADPVLNTFVDDAPLQAVALIFHELAHQVAYVKDDSSFNEGFAQTVELEGVRRWLKARGDDGEWHRYLEAGRRRDDFQAFLRTVRARLESLYRAGGESGALRAEKARILAEAAGDYARLREKWGGYAGYDGWMARGLNNARLASVATYNDRVPLFAALLAEGQGDLPAFYREVRRLAALPAGERREWLEELSARRGLERPGAGAGEAAQAPGRR